MPNFGGTNGPENATFAGVQTFAPPVEDVVQEVLAKLNKVVDKLDDVTIYTLGFPPEKIEGLRSLLDLAGSLASDGPLAAATKVPHTLASLYHADMSFVGMSDMITQNVVDLILGKPHTLPGPMPMILHGMDQANDDLGIVRPIVQSQGSTDLSALRSDIWSLPEDIWNLEKQAHPLGTTPQMLQMWEIVMYAYDAARYVLGTTGLSLPGVPGFSLLVGDTAWLPDAYSQWGDTTSIPRPGPIDLDAIVPAGGVLSYLQSTQPSFVWQYGGPDGSNQTGDDTVWAPAVGMYGAWWKCSYSDSLLSLLASPEPATIPLWPGLENVTLGEAQEFTGKILVTGPMNGILLTITSVPKGQSAYEEAGTTRYKGLGWLAFHADSGDLENHQQIEWPDSVYSPRTFMEASACDVWTKPGTSGIVQTWTHNL